MFYFSCKRFKQARTNWSCCRVSARHIWWQCTISVSCYFRSCSSQKFKYEEAFSSCSQNSAGQVQRPGKVWPCQKTCHCFSAKAVCWNSISRQLQRSKNFLFIFTELRLHCISWLHWFKSVRRRTVIHCIALHCLSLNFFSLLCALWKWLYYLLSFRWLL